MALEDRDIFLGICNRSSDMSIEAIMAQYEKAKLLNMEIEKRIGQNLEENTEPAQEVKEVEIDEIPVCEPPKKKYTRRSLKVKPQDSITDDLIYCCICGEGRQNLTSTHLNLHDITVEDYKKLCGYDANQPLMSNKRLARSREIIAMAQQRRLEKKAAHNS